MQSHIKIPPTLKSTRAIVCGSPERAEYFASLSESSKLVAKNREYHTYLVQDSGVEFFVTSHGVGAAGAGICFNELIQHGVQNIVRIGTCGALYDSNFGDIVLPLGAVRQDGLSRQMVPIEYPAVPDFDLTAELNQNLKTTQTSYRKGIIVTADMFYPGLLDGQLALYQKANVVAVEMECSALFVIGGLKSIRTAAMIVVDGEPLNWEKGKYNPNPEVLKNSLTTCYKTAVKGLAKF